MFRDRTEATLDQRGPVPGPGPVLIVEVTAERNLPLTAGNLCSEWHTVDSQHKSSVAETGLPTSSSSPQSVE